ncbi:MAG TPA: VWA domain-containing protein [Candidatus Acetothermia bacterium]|nr:VWA domain-containing protein [Candidatus Acetothermia bacterium]
MILQAPAALSLISLAGGIVFLYFLRAHNRTYDVPALFLWEGLTEDPRTRAARVRVRIDLLLIVQIMILALVSLAMAQPQRLSTAVHVQGLVIVLDASASMRAITPSGVSRYELARAQAEDLMGKYPTSPTAIISYCAHLQILSELTRDRDRLRGILSSSKATWYGDGDPKELDAVLSSVIGNYEQPMVIILTDHSERIAGAEERLILGGQNVAITSFSIREDEDMTGVRAFARLSNFTDEYVDTKLRVSDGSREVSLPVLLAPGQEQSFVLPFSGSLGPIFTASIASSDDLAADNTRYFSLPRPIERRVRWIGERNQYIEAALRASGPIKIVADDENEAVDLTVIYDETAPKDLVGSILLVHASLPGSILLGEDLELASLRVALPDDGLLAGVDPSDFRVAAAPAVIADPAGETIITASTDSPILYRLNQENRSIVLIAPDIMRTNLPLTIDFPVLVRNILAYLTPRPTPPSPTWTNVGDPLSLKGYGNPTSLTAPDGKTLATEVQRTFIPQAPGIYILKTTKGTFPLAANIPASESIPAPTAQTEALEGRTLHSEATMVPLWPQIVLLALLLCVLEAALYYGWGSPLRGFSLRGFARRKR